MKSNVYTIVFSNGVIAQNYTMKRAAEYMECFCGKVTIIKSIPEGANNG